MGKFQRPKNINNIDHKGEHWEERIIGYAMNS